MNFTHKSAAQECESGTVRTKAIGGLRFGVELHRWCFVVVEGAVDAVALVCFQSVIT